MNVWEQLALSGQCLGRTSRELVRPVLAAPWLVWIAVHVLAVTLLTFVAHPLVNGWLAPLVRRVAGDDALRYPGLFRSLPHLVGLARPVFGVALLPLIAGVSAAQFGQYWRGRPLAAGEAWSTAGRRLPALVALALAAWLLASAGDVVLARLDAGHSTGLSRALLPRLVAFAQWLVSVALAYGPALVVLGGRGVVRAFADLPRTWTPGAIPAAIALLCASLLRAPLAHLLARANSFVDHGRPEAIAAFLAGHAVADGLGRMLVSGALALAYLSAVAPSREDE